MSLLSRIKKLEDRRGINRTKGEFEDVLISFISKLGGKPESYLRIIPFVSQQWLDADMNPIGDPEPRC